MQTTFSNELLLYVNYCFWSKYHWLTGYARLTHWAYTHCVYHYKDVIISTITSQITSLTIGYSSVYSRRRSKKTSKLHVTGLCERNSPVTGEFPAQRASNSENVPIWWRHHGMTHLVYTNKFLISVIFTNSDFYWSFISPWRLRV